VYGAPLIAARAGKRRTDPHHRIIAPNGIAQNGIAPNGIAPNGANPQTISPRASQSPQPSPTSRGSPP